jgi:hypothetical protein
LTVILVTLIVPGFVLPPLSRLAGAGAGAAARAAARDARRVLLRAARARAVELERDGTVSADDLSDARQQLERRLQLVGESPDGDEQRSALATRLAAQRELLDAQRDALRELHVSGGLAASQTRALERDLDLEEARLVSELSDGPDILVSGTRTLPGRR